MKYFFYVLLLLVLACNTVSAKVFPFHDKAKVRCFDCHVSLPFEGFFLSFHEDIPIICSRCHDSSHGNAKTSNGAAFGHPVGVKPTMQIPEDMVLDTGGQVTCITCHVFHEREKAIDDINSFYLRRPPGMRFCYACHEKL
jgi:hypothetical protein